MENFQVSSDRRQNSGAWIIFCGEKKYYIFETKLSFEIKRKLKEFYAKFKWKIYPTVQQISEGNISPGHISRYPGKYQPIF